jgi:plastocyanin
MQFRFAVSAAALALALACSGCGGSSGNPGSPSPPSGGGTTVISIVGDRGSQSFSPNPGGGGQDQAIAWRNNDSVTHRIVVNDSTLDTGDIPPGATSRTLQVAISGGNYHCSIHPGMVGSVRASGGGAPPPCTGIYC